MPKGKFLVVFLLLSKVEDQRDPFHETFCSFYQELKGAEDIICICESEQIFLRWKDLMQCTCDSQEVTNRCVSALSIKEVNDTVLKLKSVTRTTRRFLPSASSGSIILQQKDEELLTALEVLCENECEGTDIETNQNRFKEFQKSMEEQFYRGGKASWWNFYFSTKVPFIKRDSYDPLVELINATSSSEKCVKIISLFHHPGCGGTTLAMHVLWDSRKKFRCAVLRNSKEDFIEIGRQVIDLVTNGASCNSDYLPVLLLVDDFEEYENVQVLQNSIQIAVAEKGLRIECPLVIILNCMRSQDPAKSSKMNPLESIALKHKLTVAEQRLFEVKLEEIEKQHTKPEDFYSFMIMKSNFDEKYIENVVHNILKDLDIASKQAQLISFLALLNSHVKDSSISVSKCEEFLEFGQVKNTFWGPEKFEDAIGIYFTLLIHTEVEEYGRYQGIRIIHPLIANRCLEELRSAYNLPKSKITTMLLNTNIFLQRGIGKEKLQQDTYSMLLTRQRKEHGDEADTLFSPLIEAIQKEEGSDQVINVLTEASNKFDQNPFISQALARHLYLIKKDFDSALEWALKAKGKAKDNSFIRDTLGQVFKSKLKYRMESVEADKQTVVTPNQLREFLDLAQSASEAFRESQQLTAMKEDRANWQERRSRLKSDVYNTLGYLGEIEVGLYVIDIIRMIPFFSGNDKINKLQLMCFLSGNMNLQHIEKENEVDEELCSMIAEYNRYLINIQISMKMAFDFFEDYFVYFKTKNIEREAAEFRIRKKVSDCFHKYTEVFYLSQLENISARKCNPKLSLPLELEDHKKFLELHKADRFAGLLEFLRNNHDRGDTMEEIVRKYKFILQNSAKKRLSKEKQNFILANIVLNCVKPNSKKIETYDKLKELLKEVLQDVGFDCGHVEPYFLGSLLFWPTNQKETDEDYRFLLKCITAIKLSFRGRYARMSHSKHPVAHFYLCKRGGLKRFAHKAEIDQFFGKVRHLNSLWQSGEIWKENEVKTLLLGMNGRTGEDNKVHIEFGNIKIPVRPVHLGKLRSGLSIENVSFYLGFSMDGPIAYDIETAN